MRRWAIGGCCDIPYHLDKRPDTRAWIQKVRLQDVGVRLGSIGGVWIVWDYSVWVRRHAVAFLLVIYAVAIGYMNRHEL